jgi:hypothetical protein
MRQEGVFILENFPSYLTTTHEPEHIDFIVRAFETSALRMREAAFWPPEERVPVPDSDPDVFDAAPSPDARLGRAPDGSPAWYVEDVENPGTYVRVT